MVLNIIFLLYLMVTISMSIIGIVLLNKLKRPRYIPKRNDTTIVFVLIVISIPTIIGMLGGIAYTFIGDGVMKLLNSAAESPDYIRGYAIIGAVSFLLLVLASIPFMLMLAGSAIILFWPIITNIYITYCLHRNLEITYTLKNWLRFNVILGVLPIMGLIITLFIN